METNMFVMSCAALAARLYEIRRRERGLLVLFLQHLVEFDRQRGYLELGFPTLFAFLMKYLGYSKSSTFRRWQSARLMGRFSVVSEYLADGRLCMSTLVELKDILTEENHREILDRAAGRTEEEVKELVAAHRPRPEPRDLLPTFRDPAPARPSLEPAQAQLPFPLAAVPDPQPASPPPVAPAAVPPAAAMPATASITPISEERRVLRMTVGREFVTDLKAVRAMLSHTIPSGSLEEVVHECLRRTLRAGEKRRQGAGKKAIDEVAPHTEGGRYIPAPIRKAVWTRDGGRCTYVGPDGHRCESTVRLQFHHVVAYAKGGRTTVENIRLACASHNRYLGELEFGKRGA